MALKFACVLGFHTFHTFALAVQKRDNSTQSIISGLTNLPVLDTSGGFTVTVNLNLPDPVNATGKVYNPDGTYNVTTGYISYVMCNNTQTSQLIQAVTDAVSLAAETLSKGELKRDASGTINFDSQDAIDYFGPPVLNQPFQSNIQAALQKAALAYSGWGVGDWWNNRYVILSCKDIEATCSEKTTAYYGVQKRGYLYPMIAFCDDWFNMPSHRGLWSYIKSNKKYQNNVSNLRSQASTMLHEWLHIGWSNAEICTQGCDDQKINISWPNAPEEVKVYRSGRSKLLAEIEPQGLELASKNNDNYVYYTLANLMYKNFGSYPQYPRAWLRSLSEADNEAREQYDNDRSVNGQSVNIAVPGDPVVADPAQPVTPAIPSALIPASDYPAAYRSILALNEDDDWSPSSSLSSLSSSTTVTTAMTSSSSPSPSTTVTTATTSSSPSPSSAHHSPGRICRYIYDSQCL